MTEQEWLNGSNPHRLVDLLGCLCSPYWRAIQSNVDAPSIARLGRGEVSARKLQLLACACCRRVGHLLTVESCRRAVEVLERNADGLADANELADAAREALQDTQGRATDAADRDAVDAVVGAVYPYADDPDDEDPLEAVDALLAAAKAALHASWALAPHTPEEDEQTWNAAIDAEDARQCVLIRDLFPNPFRPAPRVRADWLAWNGGIVVALAREIYQTQAFDQLPVLADALEDAGCDSRDVLDHLRGPGPHARGCWVIDLILLVGADRALPEGQRGFPPA